MKFSRVVLKLSGEALAGVKGFGFDHDILNGIAEQVKALVQEGVQIGVVVGGGNFWRGRQGALANMNATTADHMGMLGTTINALAMQDVLERKGVETRVQTAIEMKQFAEVYITRRAMHHLEHSRVVIFACGTGNPFFTTDTAAALRAAEIQAQAILMARNIDALYDSDPRKNNDARRIERITYDEVLSRDLRLVDNTAVALCKNNRIPMYIFQLDMQNNMMRVARGENPGTLICESDFPG